MKAYTLPLAPMAQIFTIALAGTTYQLATNWCGPAGCWTLDFSEADGTPLLTGVPLVPGTDLLGQYAYLGIGGSLFVQSAPDPDAIPQYADLGVSGLVFFVTP